MNATTPPKRRLALAAAGMALLTGCGEPPDRLPEAPDPLSAEDAARAFQVGAPAAGALAQGLSMRLGEAIEEEGLAGAVSFCSDRALTLTREIRDAHDPRLDAKRTTRRWRNPENAPDEWEERVLRYLERLEALDPDSVPPELVAGGPRDPSATTAPSGPDRCASNATGPKRRWTPTSGSSSVAAIPTTGPPGTKPERSGA